MKVIMVMVEKSQIDPFVPYGEKFKVFEHSPEGCERALAFAKKHGYEPPFLGFELGLEVGICNIYKCGDVDVRIMNQEIE